MVLLLFTIRNIYCYTLYYKYFILNDRKLNRYIYSVKHIALLSVTPRTYNTKATTDTRLCLLSIS